MSLVTRTTRDLAFLALTLMIRLSLLSEPKTFMAFKSIGLFLMTIFNFTFPLPIGIQSSKPVSLESLSKYIISALASKCLYRSQLLNCQVLLKLLLEWPYHCLQNNG
jgi:hypothetical protein